MDIAGIDTEDTEDTERILCVVLPANIVSECLMCTSHAKGVSPSLLDYLGRLHFRRSNCLSSHPLSLSITQSAPYPSLTLSLAPFFPLSLLLCPLGP